MTLTLSSVNGGPNKSLLYDTENSLYSVSKTPGLFFPGDCSILNTGTVPIEKCSFCYLLMHLRLSRELRNAGFAV